jgi:hypothetical protein
VVRARMSALRWSAGSESFGSLCSERGEEDAGGGGGKTRGPPGGGGGAKEEGKRVKMPEQCGERSWKVDGSAQGQTPARTAGV